VLAVSVLPQALRHRDPQPVRDFEHIYEWLGLPAMAVQLVTGLALAHRLLPDVFMWVEWSNPVVWTIGLKLLCLTATLALAIHARLRIVPGINTDRLPLLGIHIVAVTALALGFVWLGVCFPY